MQHDRKHDWEGLTHIWHIINTKYKDLFPFTKHVKIGINLFQYILSTTYK